MLMYCTLIQIEWDGNVDRPDRSVKILNRPGGESRVTATSFPC